MRLEIFNFIESILDFIFGGSGGGARREFRARWEFRA